MDKFKDLLELYYKGETYTCTNVGENRILVNRDGCNLIIPNDNEEHCGFYLVESIQGHDCYSYNTISTHIYNIIDGEGEFVIGDEIITVKKGSNVKIEPNKTFYYRGKMLMLLTMTPDFKEENNHIVREVTYKNEKQKKISYQSIK